MHSSPQRGWSWRAGLVIGSSLVAMLLLDAMPAGAIPAFARKYQTSCMTCHYAYPKLNAFGKAFKNNGYRYPGGQDEEMRKEEPVSLGSEAYKRVWPDAVWPTDIAGTSPISVHTRGRFEYTKADKISNFGIPDYFGFLAGGTFDDHFSYFTEVELENNIDLSYSIRLQYDFNPAANLTFGRVGLERATPQNLNLTAADYNVTQLENQSGTWKLEDGAGSGVEFWGAHNGAGGSGGFTYSAGIGNGQIDPGNSDVNNHKDVFGRLAYKIGGMGETGGTVAGQASSVSAPWVDNSLRLGGFAYSGLATAVDTAGARADDKFRVLGGDLDAWYSRLNVTAVIMTMNSEYQGTTRHSRAGFAEGNLVLYPWLFGRARYEYTDVDKDDGMKAQTSLIPSVVALVRANVKTFVEYKIPLDSASKNDAVFTWQFDFAY